MTKTISLAFALLATCAGAQWFRPTSVPAHQVSFGKYGKSTVSDAMGYLDAWLAASETNNRSLVSLSNEVRALVLNTASNQVAQSVSGIYFSGERVRASSVSGASLTTNSYGGDLLAQASLTDDQFAAGPWLRMRDLLPLATLTDKHFEEGALGTEHFIDRSINGDVLQSGSVSESELSPAVIDSLAAATAMTGEIKMFIFPPQVTNQFDAYGNPDPSYMLGWVVCDGRLIPSSPKLADNSDNPLYPLAQMLGSTYGTYTGVVTPGQVVYYGSTSPDFNNQYVRIPAITNLYVRGLDLGASIDANPGRAIGSVAGATVTAHTHASYYFGGVPSLDGVGISELKSLNGSSTSSEDKTRGIMSINPVSSVWNKPSYYYAYGMPLGKPNDSDRPTWNAWSFTSYAANQPYSKRSVTTPVVKPPSVTIYYCIATGVIQ